MYNYINSQTYYFIIVYNMLMFIVILNNKKIEKPFANFLKHQIVRFNVKVNIFRS